MKKLLLFILLFVTFFNVKSQPLLDSLKNVSPTGHVNDYQNLLTPEQKDTLERMMSDYKKKTTIEICLVTYYIEPENYSSGDVINLGEKWGVGNDNLDNGILIFLSYSNEVGKSNYFTAIGQKLDPFLPDAIVRRLNDKYLLPGFKTHNIDNIYEGYKQYIKACQEVLGNDGYAMLRKNKDIEDAKSKAAVKAFFSGLFQFVLGLLVLAGIGYFIYLQYKKRKEFLQLKSEIENIITKINSLKSKFSNNHQSTVDNICKNVVDKVTNKLVTNGTKTSMSYIYNQLLDYRQTINTIESTLEDIKKSKKDIQLYLNNNYPYCAEYLKNELKDIDKSFELKDDSSDYSRKRMNFLIGFQTSLDGKLRSFLSKSSKIYSIVNDYDNLNKKVEELKSYYNEYNKKKTILSSAKIGKRSNSLVNLDFNDHILKLKNNISTSKDYLNKGDFENANLGYATYITTLAVITGAFGSVDSLYTEYNNSVSNISREKSKLDSLISDVDDKINKSGVSYSRKSTYSSIKDDISKYQKLKDIDVIAASLLLGTIISNLDDVYYKIKSDISDYNRPSYSSSSSSYSSSSSSYSSGGSSFGGFGGGSFGGGGSGGSF